MKKRVIDMPVIAITGAACGGKTSFLEDVKDRLMREGFQPYISKESATLLMEQGMQLKKAIAAGDWARVHLYELEILGRGIENEERLKRCALIDGHPKPVLVTDRGDSRDNRAFFPEGKDGDKQYRKQLKLVNHTIPGIDLNELTSFERYTAAIDMVTAAEGAEQHYTLNNNPNRKETPAQARYLERRTQQAWLGHQHLYVINNSTGFQEKKERAFRAFFHILGIPSAIECERKYLLRVFPNIRTFPVPNFTIDIEQIYLVSPEKGITLRIRRRSLRGDNVYYLTRKKKLSPGIQEETEQRIMHKEYISLKKMRDPDRAIIEKKRTTFLWRDQYFELDRFMNFPKPHAILEREVIDLSDPVELPPFLGIDKKDEVTDDPRYSSRELARYSKKGSWPDR